MTDRNTIGRVGRMSRRSFVAMSVLAAASACTAKTAPKANPAASTGAVPALKIDDALTAAANQEGQVYFRHSANQATIDPLVAAFQAAYPQIKVTEDRRVRAEGTQLFATEERAGKHIVDVHLNTDRAGYLKLVDEGLYAKYTVPEAKQYPAGAVVPNYAIAPYYTVVVLSYNPDRLSTADATTLFNGTWAGAADPRFAGGKLGLVSPTDASQSVMWYWGLAESSKYGPDFIKKIVANKPVIASSSADGRDKLNSGEIDALIGDVLSPEQLAFSQGGKIRWTYPDILPAYATVTTFLPAHAPHPNAARLFIAWLLSDPGATAIVLKAGETPTLDSDAVRQAVDTSPVEEKLKATDWFKPFPDDAKFTPSFEDQDKKYQQYLDKMMNDFKIAS